MRVNSVSFNSTKKSFPLSKNPNILPKTLNKNLLTADCFSFKGKPIRIDFSDLGISQLKEITANQAIKAYEKLKLGSYLDIKHSSWFPSNELDYPEIRKANLSFLDALIDSNEQKKFINYYKELTGFPNLETITRRIENEFLNVIDGAEAKLSNYYPENSSKILRVGYNPTCSVGRGKALPGSDIDGAYVIINGAGNFDTDKKLIDEFKGYIWNNTDQRILSYNHESAFPNVYSLHQLDWLTYNANNVTNPMNLHSCYVKKEPSAWDKFWNDATTEYSTKFNDYLAEKESYEDNYRYANSFLIEFLNNFRDIQQSPPQFKTPNKEMMKNFAFLAETINEGCYFTKYINRTYTYDYDVIQKIIDSDFGKLVNPCQIKALKNQTTVKQKIINREMLERAFNYWGTEKQYDLIKTLIKASCGENEPYKYPEYLDTGVDRMTPFINTLKRGY